MNSLIKQKANIIPSYHRHLECDQYNQMFRISSMHDHENVTHKIQSIHRSNVAVKLSYSYFCPI